MRSGPPSVIHESVLPTDDPLPTLCRRLPPTDRPKDEADWSDLHSLWSAASWDLQIYAFDNINKMAHRREPASVWAPPPEAARDTEAARDNVRSGCVSFLLHITGHPRNDGQDRASVSEFFGGPSPHRSRVRHALAETRVRHALAAFGAALVAAGPTDDSYNRGRDFRNELIWSCVESDWRRHQSAKREPFHAPAFYLPRHRGPSKLNFDFSSHVVTIQHPAGPFRKGQMTFSFPPTCTPMETVEDFFSHLAREFGAAWWRDYLALHYLAQDSREFWYAPSLVLDAEAGKRQRDGSGARYDRAAVARVEQSILQATGIKIKLTVSDQDHAYRLIQPAGWEIQEDDWAGRAGKPGRRKLVRFEHTEPIWELRSRCFIPLPPIALTIEPRRLSLLWVLLVHARRNARQARADHPEWRLGMATAHQDAGLPVTKGQPGRPRTLVAEALEEGRTTGVLDGRIEDRPEGAVIAYTVSEDLIRRLKTIPLKTIPQRLKTIGGPRTLPP